jgi:hypothetical protein
MEDSESAREDSVAQTFCILERFHGRYAPARAKEESIAGRKAGSCAGVLSRAGIFRFAQDDALKNTYLSNTPTQYKEGTSTLKLL